METRAHNARQGGLFAGSAGVPEQQRSPPRGAAEKNVSSLLCRAGLPKGGVAIRGVREKLTANPVSDPGSFSVPIAMSPGRSGFGPQFTLSYDSGAGHGPLGPGWSLSLPSNTRKTDKGLSKYRDAEEPDVFVLSGAEDLIPVLKEQGASGCGTPSTAPLTTPPTTPWAASCGYSIVAETQLMPAGRAPTGPTSAAKSDPPSRATA
jgi:hypothetical protein